MTWWPALLSARANIVTKMVFEYGYDNHTTNFMQERGMRVAWTDTLLTDVNVVRRSPNGTFDAVSEPFLVDSGGLST